MSTQKNIINSLPALKFLAIFICGFFIFYFIELGLYFTITLIILLIILIYYFKRSKQALKQYLFSILLISLLFVNYIKNNEISSVGDNVFNQKAYISGEIKEVLSRTDTYARLIIDGVVNPKFSSSVRAKVLIEIRLINGKVSKGDRVFGEIDLGLIPKRDFWFEFPTKLYARSKDSEFYSKTSEWKLSIIRKNHEKISNSIIKSFIKNFIDRNYSEEMSGFAFVLITGDKRRIPKNLRSSFNKTGTSHILALSGLHIGIIAFIILKLLSWIKSKWLNFIIFNLILLIFLWITEFQTSSIRAYFMISSYIYIKNLERIAEPLNILAIASLIMILFNPEMIYSISFQLSFSAVLSILLFYNVIRLKLLKIKYLNSGIGEFIVSTFAISTSAFIGVTPVSCYYFGYFSILSIPANMLVVPIVSLAIIYLLLGLILSPIISISTCLCLMSDLLLQFATFINGYFVNVPGQLINDQTSLLFAISLVITIIYLVLSESLKILVFRVIVSMFIILLLVFNSPNQSWNYENNQEKCLIMIDKDNAIVVAHSKKYQEVGVNYNKLLRLINDKRNVVVISNNAYSKIDRLKYSKSVNSLYIEESELNKLYDL